MQNSNFVNKADLSDFCVNCLSVGIMGLCGLAYVFLIPILYNTEILGLFNQVYAWYIVLSQLFVFGISSAVIRMVPCLECAAEREKILSTACIITLGFSSVGNIIFYLVIHVMGPEIESRYSSIIWALMLFPLNKVLLAFINALERMKAFACFQCLRFIILVIVIVLFAYSGISGNSLIYVFGVTETVMFFSMSVYLRMIGVKVSSGHLYYLHELVQFGAKILPTNLVTEVTSKVDVISLSLVLHNDYAIGIYTFATAFSDGFYQIAVVIRKNINPRIARLYHKNELTNKLEDYKKIYIRVILPFFLVLGVLILLVYRGITYWFLEEYIDAWIILAILLFAIFINCRYIIYGNLLSQCGYPGIESFANIMTLIINFGLNIILISYVGVVGAAVATAISYIAYSLLISWGIGKKKILQ